MEVCIIGNKKHGHSSQVIAMLFQGNLFEYIGFDGTLRLIDLYDDENLNMDYYVISLGNSD